MRAYRDQIIGVTGTKGKSTTSSLIYHVLHESGINSALVGNIGKPCFDIIDDITPDMTIVFELSAHQLEFIQASPHIAVLLNIYEEHFDHYTTPDDYYAAKKNIFKFQNENDLFIYGNIFQHATEDDVKNARATKITKRISKSLPPLRTNTASVMSNSLELSQVSSPYHTV